MTKVVYIGVGVYILVRNSLVLFRLGITRVLKSIMGAFDSFSE